MKTILTCLFVVLGLTTACGQTTFETDVFNTKSGKAVTFHALVHASIRIQYDGKEIQIDPVTKLGNKVIDYASMPKADYLLVTHEHFDHFNKDAIKVLTGDKTRFITNQRCADMYGSGEIMKNGDKLQIANDITIEAVPAYNYTEGHTQFHPEMSAIKNIDIAFLPCNQPYTMTPDQLVKAARTIKPKVVFPYHYGQTDVSGIPGQLRGDGIDVRIRHYE